MPGSLLQSRRLTAWLSAALAAAKLLVLARLVAVGVTVRPTWSGDWLAVAVVTILSLASVVALTAGAWQILRRGRERSGLRWVLAGAVIALVATPGPFSSLALALAILAGLQLRDLLVPAAPPAAPIGKRRHRAIDALFWTSLVTPIVLVAVSGTYVKLTLDAAGRSTLGWSQGFGYALVLLPPFAAAFVALAFGMRGYLRRRLATDPRWVAGVGAPGWLGLLVGAAIGGLYSVWPVMMNVEASMVVLAMPWWFAQWQLAGAAAGGGLAYVFARALAARGAPPRDHRAAT